ncbi:MAG: DUF4249 domain-containing protein, partial [Bacteroidales bacterium]|nr:DUF4249 domain-containing protein [Bacteroidales bacterium]
VYNPERIPVQSCDVRIYDGNENEFIASEHSGGEYKAHIPGERLFPGAAFKLEITTPEGDLLVSGYDTLRYCPEIDSVYYAIEEYNPQIDLDDVRLYVVEGRVTDKEGLHSIFVSRASSVYNPERIPVQSCDVRIYDKNENEFVASEHSGGEYKAYIPGERLFPGAAFKLEVTTPEGDLLVSEYDTLRHCPEIDSVYYAIESFVADNDPELVPGVQFYIDYNGENSGSGKIKFEVVETWKYDTDYPIKWIWDGWSLTTYDTPDYSKSVCWRTTGSGEIYTLSTEQMSVNRYNRYPLHKVLNNSAKLLMGYSILFRQLAISEPAYRYYEKIKANSVGSGGLYETQPQQVQGNIMNMSDPDARVLGYFMVAGMDEKRIFTSEFEGLEPD